MGLLSLLWELRIPASMAPRKKKASFVSLCSISLSISKHGSVKIANTILNCSCVLGDVRKIVFHPGQP